MPHTMQKGCSFVLLDLRWLLISIALGGVGGWTLSGALFGASIERLISMLLWMHHLPFFLPSSNECNIRRLCPIANRDVCVMEMCLSLFPLSALFVALALFVCLCLLLDGCLCLSGCLFACPAHCLILHSILFTYLYIYMAPLAVKTNQRRPPVR